MNTLSIEKRKQVLNALVEGNSIRSIERMTGVHRDTIMRLLVKTGNTCEKVMNEKMRNFHPKGRGNLDQGGNGRGSYIVLYLGQQGF